MKRIIIKRSLLLLLAFGMLACVNPISVCNRSEALVEGWVTLKPKVFALPSELGTTWSKNGNGTLSNPGGTCQYINFGNYPQSEGTPASNLGTCIPGEKYSDAAGTEWVYMEDENTDPHYYKTGPIKYRILANETGYPNTLFLQSERIIDAGKRFHITNNSANINWANCALAQWVDGIPAAGYCSGCYAASGFKNNAFTEGEIGKLHTGDLSETYHRHFTDPGGQGENEGFFDNPSPLNLAPAQIFCLSLDPRYEDSEGFIVTNKKDSELCSNSLGFSNSSIIIDVLDTIVIDSRRLQLTDYADALIPDEDWNKVDGCGIYWSRSSFFLNSDLDYAAMVWFVLPSGAYHGIYANYPDVGVAPACKINLASVVFASAAPSAALPGPGNTGFAKIEGASSGSMADQTPGMYLRFEDPDVSPPTVTNDTITGTAGETVTIQGFANGKNWSYSKNLSEVTRGIESKVTLDEVNEAGIQAGVFSGGNKLTSFEEVNVWGEKLGTGEQAGLLLTCKFKHGITPDGPGNGGSNPNAPGNGGGKPNNPGNGVNSPPTGDNLQMWLWLGMTVIAGFSYWWISMRKRTKRA